MKEKHGIADAGKIAMAEGSTQSVLVTDDNNSIILSLGASSYPARLTPEQALFIANQLRAAVGRVRTNSE